MRAYGEIWQYASRLILDTKSIMLYTGVTGTITDDGSILFPDEPATVVPVFMLDAAQPKRYAQSARSVYGLRPERSWLGAFHVKKEQFFMIVLY